MSLNKVMVALDGMSKNEVYSFLNKCDGRVKIVKIGMELFYKEGHEIVHSIAKDFNVSIFLDLKLHDIPTTVSKAIKSLQGLPISYLTIHLSGGEGMLRAAKESQQQNLPKTKLLGVSYLTSLDHEDFKRIWNIDDTSTSDAFNRLFDLAYQCKIDGVVCSAHEAQSVKDRFKSLETVTPGIRFEEEIENTDKCGDQKRVLTPEEAFSNGSDFLVMGRSLTLSDNLTEKLERLK